MTCSLILRQATQLGIARGLDGIVDLCVIGHPVSGATTASACSSCQNGSYSAKAGGTAVCLLSVIYEVHLVRLVGTQGACLEQIVGWSRWVNKRMENSGEHGEVCWDDTAIAALELGFETAEAWGEQKSRVTPAM